MNKTYLSIVVTARNDNHGENMLHRIQMFFNNLSYLIEKFKINSEIIVVEWNPPKANKRLYEVINLPQQYGHLKIRFIEVPEELHYTLEHSDKIPLYQMIAKNVGIRLAQGKFVVATNIDVLFSEELIWYLSLKRLEEDCFYRLSRFDIHSRKIDEDLSVKEQLIFCQKDLHRVHTIDGTVSIEARDKIAHTFEMKGYDDAELDSILKPFIELNQNKIFTNACGDFTLLSKKHWFDLKAYPEFHKWSIYIDGLFLHLAFASGLKQMILKNPLMIYHIEHGTGWVEIEDTMKERPSLHYKDEYLVWCKDILKHNKNNYFNDENWGFAKHQLKETVFG